MSGLTTNRGRRSDGARYPSSVDGRKYTHRDMKRDIQRRKIRRMIAEQRAEREANKKPGCFGVLLALLMGAGAIVGIAQQIVG